MFQKTIFSSLRVPIIKSIKNHNPYPSLDPNTSIYIDNDEFFLLFAGSIASSQYLKTVSRKILRIRKISQTYLGLIDNIVQ